MTLNKGNSVKKEPKDDGQKIKRVDIFDNIKIPKWLKQNVSSSQNSNEQAIGKNHETFTHDRKDP